MKTQMRNFRDLLLNFWAVGVIVALLGVGNGACAQDKAEKTSAQEPEEAVTQKINIVKYLLRKVQWPSGALVNQSINLCVIGQDDTVNSISTIDGKTYNNHLIKVRTITNLRAKAAKNDCQFVYICASETQSIDQIVYFFKKRPVLLLANIENFAEKGGTMNFSKIKHQVALTINMESMNNANLKMELNEFDEITVVPSLKEIMETP